MPTAKFMGYQRERLAHRNMVDPLTHRYPRSMRELDRSHTDWVTSVIESQFEEQRMRQMFVEAPRFNDKRSWRYASWVIAAIGIAFVALALEGKI